MSGNYTQYQFPPWNSITLKHRAPKQKKNAQNSNKDSNLSLEKIPELLWTLRIITEESEKKTNILLKIIPESILKELRGRGLCHIKI